MRRSILSTLIMLVLPVIAALPSTGALAQEQYPNRPITLVNPFPPGGVADLTGRPLAAALERVLKQPVVVSNKAGAAGAVGMQSVAIAKPDGYTLLTSVPSSTLLPEVDAIFGRPPTFSRDQFAGIARLNADPVIVVVNAEAPWKNLKDLIDDAKRRPGEITFSSSGPYGASHVPTEMLLQAAGGLRMRHLPTTGGGPAMTAVLGGHAQFWCSPPAVAAPHLKSGKVRAFASTGAARHPSFPDVPTLKELGYNVEYYLWTALFVPKNVPPAIQRQLRDATRQAVQDTEFRNAMEKIQTPIAYQDADEFNAWWAEDARRLTAAVKHIGRVEEK